MNDNYIGIKFDSLPHVKLHFVEIEPVNENV